MLDGFKKNIKKGAENKLYKLVSFFLFLSLSTLLVLSNTACYCTFWSIGIGRRNVNDVGCCGDDTPPPGQYLKG